MNRPVWISLISALLVQLASSAIAQPSNPGQAYAPLARAVVMTDSDQTDRFVDQIVNFANERRYRIRRIDIPKEGRVVFNISVYVGPDSFFFIDNFLNANSVGLAAYSHDRKEVWQSAWNDLIALVSTKFGNVTVPQQ
jgi:hypothetical protein